MLKGETLLHDRYSIVHIEHTGSFSKVFFALDTYQNPPRSCLIKVFEPIVQKDRIAKWIEEEFNKELKHLKQLSLRNQHLPEIYTYSSELQVYYIVRELVEGETLGKKVQTKGKFSPQDVRAILVRLLSILKYLHHEGVIHQNIKPKNIILRDEDQMPMLINFGSIEQIVATYKFYGDKQISSVSNVQGYAPPEQALGQSVPASDLYSLGLTAAYLLTAKHPLDLPVDSNSEVKKLPHQVFQQDSDLANIITRAISSNLEKRYSCAEEMLHDLCRKDLDLNGRLSLNKPKPSDVTNQQTNSTEKQNQKSKSHNHGFLNRQSERSPTVPKSATHRAESLNRKGTVSGDVPQGISTDVRKRKHFDISLWNPFRRPPQITTDSQSESSLQRLTKGNPSQKTIKPERLKAMGSAAKKDSVTSRPVSQVNWWKIVVFTVSGLYILGAAIVALYDWRVSQNTSVRSLPEPLAPSSPPTPKSSTSEPAPPLALNSPPEDVIQIPIVATGTTKEELRKILGEPNAIQKGYWANSTAWIYKKQASDSIDLGYLFDTDTNQLRQTEVAIAPAVGLETIKDILASLLQSETTPLIDQELRKVYNRQISEYSFSFGELEGSINREPDGHIYLGVWEANFH